MNKFIEAEDYKMFYQHGKLYKKVQYVKFSRADQEYLRYMYSMLYGHIVEYRYTSTDQSALFDWFFTENQTHLPRPTKLSGRIYNTWGTFLEGLEDNFESGTTNFTTKHLKGVEEIVNYAVDYFTIAHSDFEPNEEAPRIKMIPANKAVMVATA